MSTKLFASLMLVGALAGCNTADRDFRSSAGTGGGGDGNGAGVGNIGGGAGGSVVGQGNGGEGGDSNGGDGGDGDGDSGGGSGGDGGGQGNRGGGTAGDGGSGGEGGDRGNGGTTAEAGAGGVGGADGGDGGAGGGATSGCPNETFRGAGDSSCTPWSSCSMGEYQVTAPGNDHDRVCDSCADGDFSDSVDATGCTTWSTCDPGSFVDEDGTDARDRTCLPCPNATFSTVPNAPSCTAWAPCENGQVSAAEASATQNQTCEAGWGNQFGSASVDIGVAVAVDGSGNVLVGGSTAGALPSESSAGDYDGFVRKYEPDGTFLWTSQFGTSAVDLVHAVAVEETGNVTAVGETYAALNAQPWSGGRDVFVIKFQVDGDTAWTREFGDDGEDAASGVAVDDAGNVFVVGFTDGDIEGQSLGGFDAFVRKYDATGGVAWTYQFGTGEDDYARAIALDPNGNLLVVGDTDGSLSQTNLGGRDGFVTKLSPTGVPVWTHQFGTDSGEYVQAVAVDGIGNVFAVGDTTGTLPLQAAVGARDMFLRKLDDEGSVLWTVQFGTTEFDAVSSVHVDGANHVLVGGEVSGALPGESSLGMEDAFVQKYDADGKLIRTTQFGSSASDRVTGLNSDDAGNAIVAGQTGGTLPGRSSAGGTDAFVMVVAD